MTGGTGGRAPRRRVVITGIGAITPVGSGRHGLWEGVRRGVSAVDTITRFDARDFPCRIAAEVRDFIPTDHLPGPLACRLDRYAQFAVAAAAMAVADSRLDPAAVEDGRAGVYIGSALGGIAGAEAEHAGFLTRPERAIDAERALAAFGPAALTHVAASVGFTGPSQCNSNACAAGAVALGEALHAIRAGLIDVALAGGAEAPLMPLTFGSFTLVRAMSTRNEEPGRASRPFDRARDGFVMGEGAAMLVLEERKRAVRRGASPLAEIVGYGQTCDAYHIVAPQPDGIQAARAIRLALRDACLPPEAISYVKAHGTATRLNDPAEAAAIHKALGCHAARVFVSATKGLHAHALGASGAIEAAIVALALHHGYLPATTNLEDPDPSCALRFIRGEGRPERVDYAVCNSSGFGGINAALVLGRADAA